MSITTARHHSEYSFFWKNFVPVTTQGNAKMIVGDAKHRRATKLTVPVREKKKKKELKKKIEHEKQKNVHT